MAMNSHIARYEKKENPRFLVRNSTTQNILTWGADNGYPTKMSRILHASPVGVACRKKMVQFLVGEGFENEEFNKLVINRKGQTLSELLDQIACDITDYSPFHLHLTYNLNHEIDSIRRVSPEYVRKTSPDSFGFSPKSIIYNNFYRDNYARAEFTYTWHEVNTYSSDPGIIMAQIGEKSIRDWNGQLFSFWGDGEHYPRTIYDAVIDDLKTDAFMSSKSKTDIERGYMAGTVIKVKDKLSDTERATFMGHVKEVQGPDGGRILVIDGVADGIEIDTIATNFSDGQFTLTEQRVRRSIIRSFGQLPILHGEERQGALGGDGKALEVAFKIYNAETKRLRASISESISKLMRNFKDPIEDDFLIKPLSFEVDEVANQMEE